MGNTPSNQSGQGPSGNTASPTRRGSTSAHGLRSSPAQPSRSQANNVLPHRQHAGRHQQGQRSDGTQGSTASIHQTSSSPSSNRPVSPRRRKSLELPDLNNKLTFTNANAQGGGLEQTHAETVETQIAAGSGRVRSPLAGPPPSSFAYDEESSLGNTPANSKRTSLTSGTRARSPQASNVGITSSLGEGMNRGASGTSMGAREGMPIPGAKPARRVITGADESDNPYFPPVAKQRPPVTPGLPNYSHSPHTGNDGSGVGLAHVEHAEQAEYDFVGRDRLSVNTNIPPTGARQPSPARPAPAVVTTEHHHMVSPPDVLVSALPHGMIGQAGTDQDSQLAPAIQTPLASLQTPLALDPNQTPLGMPPGAGNEGRALEEEEETASVPTLVTWNEGGRNVYVTGTFADNGWKARLKMNKRSVRVGSRKFASNSTNRFGASMSFSTHDFSLLLNLPPGTHRLKFIVDDHWRCSSELQTATDGDGNLVNWLEVRSPPVHQRWKAHCPDYRRELVSLRWSRPRNRSIRMKTGLWRNGLRKSVAPKWSKVSRITWHVTNIDP